MHPCPGATPQLPACWTAFVGVHVGAWDRVRVHAETRAGWRALTVARRAAVY